MLDPQAVRDFLKAKNEGKRWVECRGPRLSATRKCRLFDNDDPTLSVTRKLLGWQVCASRRMTEAEDWEGFARR